ncbi:MAG: type II toxin-antitoxin system RelE/ParE family toxin [Lysobacter spongiicola]|nr:type II toxin-antitoxin system RelE/ParE family toxin [Lysobacter spongiicola]
MTRVRLAPGVIEDLDRIVGHLQDHDIKGAEARAGEIISAFDVLADNPLIGRPAEDDKRELLIGHSSRGYIALYRYLPVIDIVLVLAIRAQREAGYARP